MKKKIRTFALLLMALTFTTGLSAQDKGTDAKKYFEKVMSTDAVMDLIKKSLPTRDECAMVFNGTDADTYYKMVEKIKSQMATEEVKNKETFVDQSISSFTTEDVVAGKGNYAGGMKKIAGKLKPGTTFYALNLLRQKGAATGVDYKYWVYVNNHWVFFPKMWSAFK